ncbi:MAG: alpha/beta hydrolase [Gordonia sp. (in: high G+C Gram-positive bacteria)]
MTIHSTDHRYASRSEGDLWLTVYRQDVPTLAILVYFHGGGWAAGDRTAFNLESRVLPLTADGIVVVSADYRLSGAAVWPAQLQDAGDVIEWVADSIESAPIFVSGASAGGHLAGLVGLGAWERLVGRPHQRRAAGVITYAAVTDPLQWDTERLNAPLPLPGTFAHWSYTQRGQWPPRRLGHQLLDGADTRISPRLANHVDTDPPAFVIIHGDRDTCVSHREAVELFDVLSSRGGEAFLLEIAGADHEDPAFDTPLVRALITTFIHTHSAAHPDADQAANRTDD